MAKLILDTRVENPEENLFKNLKKYRVKISMIRPCEIVDFWVSKPDENNALELFVQELLFTDLSKHFKIEISEE